MLCAPTSVRVSLTMTTVDGTTTAASIALNTHDRDVGKRQMIVEVATDTSV